MATPKTKLGRPRVLDQATPISFYIPESMHRELDMYVEVSDDSRSEAIRKAWRQFVRRLPSAVRAIVEGA